jgi:1-acyl-sn-glycerol-3-phosphate acyltransferase
MDRVETVARALVPVARGVGRALFDLEWEGFEHVPARDGVVIAANHFSHIDPVVISACAGRNVRYLGVDELFGRSRIFDGVTLFFRAIPMSRERAPLGALREAMEGLERGEAVGVFPEGKRVVAWGDITPPKRGAAWLSFATGAPLVPVAILGSEGTMGLEERWLRPTSIRAAAGPPLWWHDYVDRVDPLATMMADWEAWLDERLGHWYRARSS